MEVALSKSEDMRMSATGWVLKKEKRREEKRKEEGWREDRTSHDFDAPEHLSV